MPSVEETLYKKHHVEFESWFNTIHPNNELDFEWLSTWDCGWYREEMAQGAWIAWLALTKKTP